MARPIRRAIPIGGGDEFMPAFIDITGEKYGRLTAIRKDSQGSRKAKGKWLFKCDCGNELLCTANRVRSGNTKSCGCLKSEVLSDLGKESIKSLHQQQVTHGMTGSRICRILKNMKTRCYNTKTECFKYYGGKGITICDEWLNNSQKFIDWALSHKYNDKLTIERKNSNKGYSPDNCEFITQSEQARRSLIVRMQNKRNACNV